MTTTHNYKFRWRSLTSSAVTTFSELSTATGFVTGIPQDRLPPGHQKMGGLQAALWSGYGEPAFVACGYTGVGELVLIRHDDGKSKAYCYSVGQSGDSLCISPEFKDFDGHHSPVEAPASFGMMFGNLPWPQTSTNKTGNC